MPHAKPLASILALVVDDEAPARRYLSLLLRRDPDIGSVIECGSGLEAIEEIRRSRPDLPCFGVKCECDLVGASNYWARIVSAVIFVTAYAAYALRAFRSGRSRQHSGSPWTARASAPRARARQKVGFARGTPYHAHSVGRIAVKSGRPDTVLKGLGNRLDRSREGILCACCGG